MSPPSTVRAQLTRLLSLRRFCRGWQKVRPLPQPRYAERTPRVGEMAPPGVFRVPNVPTLAAAATSHEAVCFVADLIDLMTPSDEIAGQQAFYRLAQAQFGRHFRYADLTTTLWAAASLIRPAAYLEIGVRRGRSACVVGATSPACSLVGFDLWVDGYAGVPNPGADFVQGELRAVGHQGDVELVSGDSRRTVPAFLKQHPEAFFDLITVDGDHTTLGAAIDLANVLPRLKVGGIVLFDDIVQTPPLRRVWDRLVKRDSRYATWEYTDDGDGVAAAIRIGDEPWLRRA